MADYVNPQGFRFHKGLVIPPIPTVPTRTKHTFDPATDEPQHTREPKPFHAPFVKVMETLGEPESPFFRYSVGQYVYLHSHAYETNGLDALECVIVDVSRQPLEIKVSPCNHPEDVRTVCADKLSAPIYV